MQNPPPIQIGGRVSKSLYQFTMQGSDINAVSGGRRTGERGAEVPLLKTSRRICGSATRRRVSRSIAIARRRGVTAEQSDRVRCVWLTPSVDDLHERRGYWVVMELLPQYQLDLGAMSMLYIRSKAGTLVPLSRRGDPQSWCVEREPFWAAAVGDVVALRPGVSLGRRRPRYKVANKVCRHR